MEGYLQFNPQIARRVGNKAALVYAALKSRWQLSVANGDKWRDKIGVFCRYARQELCQLLNLSRPSITKAMRALVAAGLIIDKRLGLGHTNKIYLFEEDSSQKEKISSSTQKADTPSKKQRDTRAKGNNQSHGYTPTGANNWKNYTNTVCRAPAATGYAQHNYAPGELDRVYADIMKDYKPDK